MDADHHDNPLIASPLFRGLIAVACLGAFFVVASVINPDQSKAGQSQPIIVNGNSADSNKPESTTLLGTLLGLKYTIEMFGTEQGVLYTVFDESGQTLVELATPTEVQQAIPDLDLEALKAQQMSEVDTFDPMGGF